MFELEAFDADRKCTADVIATKAEGPSANVNGFKTHLSDLVDRRLLESKVGREGGYWLTSAGRALIEAFDGGAMADEPAT